MGVFVWDVQHLNGLLSFSVTSSQSAKILVGAKFLVPMRLQIVVKDYLCPFKTSDV